MNDTSKRFQLVGGDSLNQDEGKAPGVLPASEEIPAAEEAPFDRDAYYQALVDDTVEALDAVLERMRKQLPLFGGGMDVAVLDAALIKLFNGRFRLMPGIDKLWIK